MSSNIDNFNKMRDDTFKEKVGSYSAKEIIRTAKDRHVGSVGYAEAMLIAYNKKMKYPLRWSNLYSNKKGYRPVEAEIEEELDLPPEETEGMDESNMEMEEPMML